MALIACHECETQISTEAKTCPKCGAINKSRKRTSRWIITIFVIIVTYVTYVIYEDELNTNIPACNSSYGSKLFKSTFEGSPFAQKNKLRAIEITNQIDKSTSSNPEDRVCEVTLILNDSSEKVYVFTFEKNKNGGYFIQGKSK